MRRKTVTIKDVAQLAGVGISTVSYVINGHDNHVSQATRDVILAAARDLNYRPNAIARSMVQRKTATIGLIITELQNALFIPVTEGVEDVLQPQGYHILLASAGDIASEINAIETMRARQVDGFIIMSLSMRFPTDHLMQLHDAGIPFVVINRDLDSDVINQVRMDEIGAGRMAAEHLLSLGHTNIALIAGTLSNNPLIQRRSAIERYQGWRTTLEQRNITNSDHWVIDGNYTFEGGYQAGIQLARRIREDSEPPTACFVSSDMMAMGAMKALHDEGLSVPRDIAIVAVGDPPFARFMIPALTTLALPIAEAGRIAAQIVVDNLNADKPLEPQHITLSSMLQIRESCGTNISELRR